MNENRTVELRKFNDHDWYAFAWAEEGDGDLGPYMSGDFKIGDLDAFAIIDKKGIEVYIDDPADLDCQTSYRKNFDGISKAVEFFVTHFRRNLSVLTFHSLCWL